MRHILFLLLIAGSLYVYAQSNGSAKTNAKTRSLLMRAGIEAGHNKMNHLNPVITFFVTRPSGAEWIITPYFIRVLNEKETIISKSLRIENKKYEPKAGLRLGYRSYIGKNKKLRSFWSVLADANFAMETQFYYERTPENKFSGIEYEYIGGVSAHLPIGIQWQLSKNWSVELEANFKLAHAYRTQYIYQVVVDSGGLVTDFSYPVPHYRIGVSKLFSIFDNYLPYLQLGLRCRLFTQPIRSKKKDN